MRLHGLVSLALLAISLPAAAQDSAPPAPLDRQISPDLIRVPLRAGIPRSQESSADRTTLESEIEALHEDLQAFHALSEEVARTTRAAEAETDRSMVRQRQEMLDILTKLATQGVTGRGSNKADGRKQNLATEPIPPVPDPITAPAVTDAAVDQFALGKVLFRAGEYGKAEQAFRKVTANDENRLMLKYLIATCLRKRSQWQAAGETYREIAASDKDPVLRDLAKFQLDGIRWNQDTEKQIELFRKQRDTKPAPKLTP